MAAHLKVVLGYLERDDERVDEGLDQFAPFRVFRFVRARQVEYSERHEHHRLQEQEDSPTPQELARRLSQDWHERVGGQDEGARRDRQRTEYKHERRVLWVQVREGHHVCHFTPARGPRHTLTQCSPQRYMYMTSVVRIAYKL